MTASIAGPGKVELMTQQTGCRAAESLVYTASANHAGKERTLSFYGHSTIAGPSIRRRSKILAQGEYSEDIVTAPLSLETLEYSQSFHDVRKDINWRLNLFSWLRWH